MMLLRHPTASYENNRHEGINAGMLLLMADVLHMAGFKICKSLFLYMFKSILVFKPRSV